MAQINILKTNRADALTAGLDKVGIFVDENGITCTIDDNGVITEIGADKSGIKRYKALISQKGKDNPTAEVLENNGNLKVNFVRNEAGNYSLLFNVENYFYTQFYFKKDTPWGIVEIITFYMINEIMIIKTGGDPMLPDGIFNIPILIEYI